MGLAGWCPTGPRRAQGGICPASRRRMARRPAGGRSGVLRGGVERFVGVGGVPEADRGAGGGRPGRAEPAASVGGSEGRPRKPPLRPRANRRGRTHRLGAPVARREIVVRDVVGGSRLRPRAQFGRRRLPGESHAGRRVVEGSRRRPGASSGRRRAPGESQPVREVVGGACRGRSRCPGSAGPPANRVPFARSSKGRVGARDSGRAATVAGAPNPVSQVVERARRRRTRHPGGHGRRRTDAVRAAASGRVPSDSFPPTRSLGLDSVRAVPSGRFH